MSAPIHVLIAIVHIGVFYYLTSYTTLECPTTIKEGYEIYTEMRNMVYYKYTITYCDDKFIEYLRTPVNIETSIKNDWLKQHPHMTYYQSMWGLHSYGASILINFIIGYFILISFVAYCGVSQLDFPIKKMNGNNFPTLSQKMR